MIPLPHDFVYFRCRNAGCHFRGIANSPTDFEGVICNGEKIYSISCPHCHTKREIKKDRIPASLLEYISLRVATLTNQF